MNSRRRVRKDQVATLDPCAVIFLAATVMLFSRAKPSKLPAVALACQEMALARYAGWILEEPHEQNYVFASDSSGSRRQA